MSSSNDQPTQMFSDIIEEAFKRGADTIEIEVEPDGVELFFMTDNHGSGSLLDLNKGLELISFILERANIKGNRGALTIPRGNEACTILVKAFQVDDGFEYHLSLPKV